MRKIITRDVFKLARILKAGNFRDELATIFSEAGSGGTLTDEQGLDFLFSVVFGLTSETQEKAVYDLLGGILEKDPEAVADETIEALRADITAIAKDNNLSVFFQQAQALTQSKG